MAYQFKINLTQIEINPKIKSNLSLLPLYRSFLSCLTFLILLWISVTIPDENIVEGRYSKPYL